MKLISMPVTDAYAQETLRKLSEARPIRSRKMFGGVGIYCEETFFAVIDDDRLYFKADELSSWRYDEVDAAQWHISGEPKPQPYREVPASLLDDPDGLGTWIDEAVAVAVRKKSKKG